MTNERGKKAMKTELISCGDQEGHRLEIEQTKKKMFLRFDGIRIAKRDGGKWIPLLPGWEITDYYVGGRQEIEVSFEGKPTIPIGPAPKEVH